MKFSHKILPCRGNSHDIASLEGVIMFSVDDAVLFAHNGVMNNAGQCCVAGSRTFVHEKIYDQFVAKSRELAEKRQTVTGDPFDPKTLQGPQVLSISYSLEVLDSLIDVKLNKNSSISGR